jgi:hypothetical protein
MIAVSQCSKGNRTSALHTHRPAPGCEDDPGLLAASASLQHHFQVDTSWQTLHIFARGFVCWSIDMWTACFI